MKKRFTRVLVLAMALMASSSVWAQVRETTTYDDGSYYTGERDAKGRRHGNGLMVFANGDRYEGNFVQNHLSGYGKMKYGDGSSYEGNWYKDMYEGEGTYISADGEVIKGRFHEGQLIERNE